MSKDTNLISVPGQTVHVSLGALRSGGGVNKRCVFEIRKTRNIFLAYYYCENMNFEEKNW